MLKTSKFERRTTVAKSIISGFILFFLLIFSAAEPTSAAFWDTKGDNIIHDPSMIRRKYVVYIRHGYRQWNPRHQIDRRKNMERSAKHICNSIIMVEKVRAEP